MVPRLTYEQAVRAWRSEPGTEAAVRDAYLDEDPVPAAQRFRESPEFAFTDTLLRGFLGGAPAPLLLDVGAGNGIASFAFARAGYRVVAAEPGTSEEVGARAIMSVAARTRTAMPVVCAPGEGLPFPAETFDCVYARQVLHHARDLFRMVGEAARVLKPGGIFLAAREHVADDETQLARFLAEHPLQKYHAEENAYPVARYVEALRAAGLRVRRVFHPLSAVINFAPRTEADIDAQAITWARARLGPLASWIGSSRILAPALPLPRGPGSVAGPPLLLRGPEAPEVRMSGIADRAGV